MISVEISFVPKMASETFIKSEDVCPKSHQLTVCLLIKRASFVKNTLKCAVFIQLRYWERISKNLSLPHFNRESGLPTGLGMRISDASGGSNLGDAPKSRIVSRVFDASEFASSRKNLLLVMFGYFIGSIDYFRINNAYAVLPRRPISTRHACAALGVMRQELKWRSRSFH